MHSTQKVKNILKAGKFQRIRKITKKGNCNPDYCTHRWIDAKDERQIYAYLILQKCQICGAEATV